MNSLHWMMCLVSVVAAYWIVLILFSSYVIFRYGDQIYVTFETKPLFLVPPTIPDRQANQIEFFTSARRKLAGSYFACTTADRRGVVLFCHEFGASRWLYDAYVGYLRADGFDIFTFDFVNHGDSERILDYDSLHWVSEHEVSDVRAAVEYLKRRPDADPKGVGILGVSKGGGAALVAAGKEPRACSQKAVTIQ